MKKLIDVIELLAYGCDYNLSQYNLDELEQIQRDLETVKSKLSGLEDEIIKREDEDMKELSGKIETIKGLEMALKHAEWGIRYMTLEQNGYGDYIRVDFKDVYRPSYHINITGSSPQGIIIDVMRFINNKGEEW